MPDKTVYLTVDLDYWNTESEPTAGSMVKKVLSLNIPVSLYVDHHMVLKDLKGEAFTKIINVDEHDDLPPDLSDELNEGNWVGHVPFRESAIYEWRCPSSGGCACDGQDGEATWGEGEEVGLVTVRI
jgi:hypothetical protein